MFSKDVERLPGDARLDQSKEYKRWSGTGISGDKERPTRQTCERSSRRWSGVIDSVDGGEDATRLATESQFMNKTDDQTRASMTHYRVVG